MQGGAAPVVVGHDFDVDPYPTASVESSFADMWCASLSHCMKRFEGKRATYKNVRSGGVGCFTADSFPVFDYMRPNAYVIADSNHGYKMIGVGREVARVVAGGDSSLLHPFRYERFATGDLHPVSNSPYPWSDPAAGACAATMSAAVTPAASAVRHSPSTTAATGATTAPTNPDAVSARVAAAESAAAPSPIAATRQSSTATRRRPGPGRGRPGTGAGPARCARLTGHQCRGPRAGAGRRERDRPTATAPFATSAAKVATAVANAEPVADVAGSGRARHMRAHVLAGDQPDDVVAGRDAADRVRQDRDGGRAHASASATTPAATSTAPVALPRETGLAEDDGGQHRRHDDARLAHRRHRCGRGQPQGGQDERVRQEHRDAGRGRPAREPVPDDPGAARGREARA